MENNNKPSNEIQVELSEEMAGVLMQTWQLFHIQHQSLYSTFIRVVPGARKAQVKSRVILTPDNAKRLFLHCRITWQNMKNS